jgi:hypothetical protein
MIEKQYIRVIKDGFIYDYNPRMADHPECEVISEKEAFPERFITPEVEKRIKKTRQSKQTSGVEVPATPVINLATDIPEEPVYTDPELAAEAGRNWPE